MLCNLQVEEIVMGGEAAIINMVKYQYNIKPALNFGNRYFGRLNFMREGEVKSIVY